MTSFLLLGLPVARSVVHVNGIPGFYFSSRFLSYCKQKMSSIIRRVTHHPSSNLIRLVRNVHKGSNLGQMARFVPKCERTDSELDYITNQLNDFILDYPKLFVITGAGISTESGIRDYRSEGVGLYSISNQRPMDYQDFLRSDQNRQRYWARNFVGWEEFGSRQPNSSHFALTRLERLGFVHSLVTQNVDALHTKAGGRKVIELHGCSHRVICLGCHQVTSRNSLQELFHQLNPDWHAVGQVQAPDGDTFLDDNIVKKFNVPPCQQCGGILKPQVVFFGDSVPKDTVKQASEHLKESNALLVVGSTVEVYSAYRFILQAKEQKKPIAILNVGKTRADHVASMKLSALCGSVLPRLEILNEKRYYD